MPERSAIVNEMLRLAFEACPAGMFMADHNGRLELVNAQCEQMFGYERGQMIGMEVETLVPGQARVGHRQLREGFSANPSKRLMGVGRDLRALRRDGSEFPVEIGLTPIVTPLGHRVLAFVVDISARLASEQAIRRYAEELERANEGLARFAYVASHDIQEPLRKIAAFAEILQNALGGNDHPEARYASDVMAKSALQARRLVADLLVLARSTNSVYALEEISARGAVDEVLENLSHAIAAEGAHVEISGEDFSIMADRSQAVQLAQNIIANALKYHQPGRPPEIQIRLGRLADGACSLAIQDRGVGFPSAYNEEIFEPFRRLHAHGDFPGAGIGLAICKTIASRHGWRLSAAAAPMQGSTFEVVFPRK